MYGFPVLIGTIEKTEVSEIRKFFLNVLIIVSDFIRIGQPESTNLYKIFLIVLVGRGDFETQLLCKEKNDGP